jgi:hypothetical protein
MDGLETNLIINSNELIASQDDLGLVFEKLHSPGGGFVEMLVDVFDEVGLFVELDLTR